ncbi:MAG: hypothetical protein HY901_03690 [Deltaproteobacteria bacterium]|nr:hypothetical protein [Deltaproteobacteria bacterium]
MKASIAFFALFFLSLPADAETCEELRETCIEGCHVDHGMEKARVKLTKCVSGCDRALADCAETRQEERRSQVRLRDPDPERRPSTEDGASAFRQAQSDEAGDSSSSPRARRRKASSAKEDDESEDGEASSSPPGRQPDREDPPRRASRTLESDDAEAPPKARRDSRPPKEPKKSELPDAKGSDDDWAK